MCLLVIIGVRADGAKELVALDDGQPRVHRVLGRSAPLTPSAAGCALRCSRSVTVRSGSGPRCATCSPRPEEQRCWFHKIANVLNALPKSAQPGAKAALAEIWNAEDRDHARAAARTFADAYGTKWPKAAAKITDDLDVLLAFYDYPAEHWIHLRTTNPIESTFATIRLRQRVTKGPGSRAAGIAMAFKLIEVRPTPLARRQRPHLVALVRAGADLNGRSSNDPTTNLTTSQEITLKPRERSICGWLTRSAR